MAGLFVACMMPASRRPTIAVTGARILEPDADPTTGGPVCLGAPPRRPRASVSRQATRGTESARAHRHAALTSFVARVTA